MNRVVITGIGCVTPIGSSFEDVKNNLLSGNTGISYNEDINACVGIIRDDINSKFEQFDKTITDRFSRLAWLAYTQAKNDSLVKPEGILLGVGYGGGAHALEQAYSDLARSGRVRPNSLVCCMPSNAANFVALKDDIDGPVITYTAACSSSSVAIGEAYLKIKNNELTTVAAGGAESCIINLSTAQWHSMLALSIDKNFPEKACRPFSNDRKGIVFSEGAVIFILESLDSAVKRGAKIYCEISDYAYSCGAETITKPNKKGQISVIDKISKKLFPHKEKIYINAHGTGTPVGDIVELESIHEVFKSHCENIPISSTKSLHGHLLGAAGAMESLSCITAITENIIIPNYNITEFDSSIPKTIFLPTEKIQDRVDVALNNSFAFGGTNVVLAFRKLI